MNGVRSLWLEWTLRTTISMAVGLMACIAIAGIVLSGAMGFVDIPGGDALAIFAVLGGATVGLVVGAAQAFCLRRRFGVRFGAWLTASVAGSALGWAIVTAGALALLPFDPSARVTTWVFAGACVLAGALFGRMQRHVLLRTGGFPPATGWWIPAQAAAWLAAALILVKGWSAVPFARDEWTAALHGGVAAIAAGLASGLIGGIALQAMVAAPRLSLSLRNSLSPFGPRRHLPRARHA